MFSYLSTLPSCFPFRDFVCLVKLIVGAFFYFFNKNELEKNLDQVSCPAGEGAVPRVQRQLCIIFLLAESRWPFLWRNLEDVLRNKLTKRQPERERIEEELLSFDRAHAIRVFYAKG